MLQAYLEGVFFFYIFREILYEALHGKTNNLHRRKQRNISVTAKLISAFFTRIVHFYPKFQASSLPLCLYRSVCVRPGRNPNCLFSDAQAHISAEQSKQLIFWLQSRCNIDLQL